MGNWPSPMTGPSVLCVNQPGTFTYNTIVGGIGYVWTVNGTIQPPADKIEDVPISSFSRTFSFSTPGTYTLCVDGLNDCVPFTADPSPLCKTITVVGPVDGDITATPTPYVLVELSILLLQDMTPKTPNILSLSIPQV
ncbi:MAG: hypothetical protein IPL08_00025 [Saprospiraceae bacterium]|nr:hypothetical protein [Saprospiraceae bacterium]